MPILISIGIVIITIFSLYYYNFIDVERDIISRKKKSTSINTSEIIRILENEDVVSVSTSHLNFISIKLGNGELYYGKYNQNNAGKYYTENPFLDDVLSLVGHIESKRRINGGKKWKIICE